VVLRNLLDQAQASLATISGLDIDDGIRPSVVWRTHFPNEMTDFNRIKEAKSLFADRDDTHA
jgi:hypothetical protein